MLVKIAVVAHVTVDLLALIVVVLIGQLVLFGRLHDCSKDQGTPAPSTMSRIHIHHQRDEYALVEQRDRHRYTGLEWEALEPTNARLMWPLFRAAITAHFDAQGIHGGQSVRLLSISNSAGNLMESLRLAARQSELPRALTHEWAMFRKVMLGYRFDPRPDPTDALVPTQTETQTDWIEVAVLDADGNALDDNSYTYKYEFLLTNGQTLTGDIVLENGNIKVPDLVSGLCEFKITRTPKP